MAERESLLPGHGRRVARHEPRKVPPSPRERGELRGYPEVARKMFRGARLLNSAICGRCLGQTFPNVGPMLPVMKLVLHVKHTEGG